VVFARPSAAGRRLALQRKFEINVQAYGAALALLTLTALGSDLLPWDCEQDHKHDGREGCRVEWIYALVWNATAQKRASRLFEAAQRSADRFLMRAYGLDKQQLPRQIGNVGKVLQERGVFHFHWLMPNGSELERIWSRHVRRFMQQALKREQALGPEYVWRALEREFHTGEVTKGVYGFGFSHPGRRRRSGHEAARYMARNAAGYVAGQGGGRHYVSTRLTRITGATMRPLKDLNYLYVRRRLIDAGELVDELYPFHWSEDRRLTALRVQGLVAGLQPSAP